MAEIDFDQINNDAQEGPPVDRLVTLRTGLGTLREKQAELDELTARQLALKAEINDLKFRKLVDMMLDCNMTQLSLEPEGNYPACVAKMRRVYSGKIPEERAGEAFAFLDDHGYIDEIRVMFKVDTKFNTDEQVEQIKAVLEAVQAQYVAERTVHAQTLKRIIRELDERGEMTPTDSVNPKEILGAFIGDEVELKPVEEKKSNGKRNDKRG
jgi:hypothetical protein